MTDREAVKQALETLELVRSSHNVMLLSDPPQDAWKTRGIDFKILQVITALRERLEQPEQEPVAWMDRDGDLYSMPVIENWSPPHTLLYTSPPQQQAEPVHGDIRALRYRIFELEGEVLGYKRMLDVAEAQPQPQPLTDEDIEQAQREVWRSLPSDFDYTTSSWIELGIRYAEAAHDIKETP